MIEIDLISDKNRKEEPHFIYRSLKVLLSKYFIAFTSKTFKKILQKSTILYWGLGRLEPRSFFFRAQLLFTTAYDIFDICHKTYKTKSNVNKQLTQHVG